MIVTLLVSTGAAWESQALQRLDRHPGTVVLKRCVDVDDLLATASTGQAQVAVLAADLAGLDAQVVQQLHACGLRVVAVAAEVDRAVAHASRIGIGVVLPADDVDRLTEVVADGAAAAAPQPPPIPAGAAPATEPGPVAAGRVIAVHGPGGGPGRTTIAVNLAAELAHRDRATLLVDADPYGGAVAQQLGILDEVSGLLSAARLSAAGTLAERLPTVQRVVGGPFRVLTGLPRPDRWSEVRPGALTEVIEHASAGADVVVDTGFSLEQSPMGDQGSIPERNGLTLEALACADEILLVGAADPVGLSRLARAVADVHEVVTAPRLRVVVNRMRPTLGWRESDVSALLGDFGNSVGVHFLADDRTGVDRALVAGRSLVEIGEGPLRRAIAGLADHVVGLPAQAENSR